ncbi:aldehyde dehydrogenase [Spirochaetia bacterium]|nr:aldehyde dehydrogenase [Spirochaetia bacterium]
MDTADEVKSKIHAARAAQKVWAELPYNQRARHVKRSQKFLAAHIEEIAEAIHRDTGKLVFDALSAELLPAVMGISYYLKQGKHFCADKKIHGGSIVLFNKISRMVHVPYGVIGIISPWNYPFAIPFSEVVMALLAGNAVVLKVASSTPEVGRALCRVFEAGELPAGLFSYIEMAGEEAGRVFAGTGGVDKLFFTGSTRAGKEIAKLASDRLLPLVLELGGADAAIIRSDADLDRAASGIIWAGFANGGQSCGGVQRVFIHKSVYGAFLENLTRKIQNLRTGSGLDDDLGPLAGSKQKERFDAQIERCLAAGDRIAAQSALPGNEAKGGFFVRATVLTRETFDVYAPQQSPALSEEIFGPVVIVLPVANDGEALIAANNSSYALTGSVWSRSSAAAKALSSRINAGAVMINDHLMSHGLAETPWGGFGDSGLGRTHGKAGFYEMLRAKVVIDDILPGVKRNLWWHPYSKKVCSGVMAIVDLLSAASPLKRLLAVPNVVRVFLRSWGK